MSGRKPIAYLCQCNHEASRIERLLNSSGFDVKSRISLSSIVHLIAESADNSADLFVSCVQDGGLAVPQILGQYDPEFRPMVVLFDVDDDIPSAIKALRMRVTDYVLARATDDHIHERFASLAQRIEAHHRLSDEVMAGMPAAHGAYAIAGTGQPHGAAVPGNGNASHHHNIWWDANLCAIRSDEMWVPLSPIEWKLFETLVNRRGVVVATEDLINTALSRSGTSAADTSLLRLHVSRLRAKLNEHFAQELSIVTMRGRGYMLI